MVCFTLLVSIAHGQIVSGGGGGVAGTVTIENFPATQPVTGTVSVGNFPATQPVSVAAPISVRCLDLTGIAFESCAGVGGGSGTVSVDNFPVTQAVTVGNFPITQPVTVGNFPATQPVSGTVSVGNFPATQPVSGTVSVGNFPATQPVSGTFWPATQPVTLTQNGARFNCAFTTTATASTAITGCLASVGNAYYITDISITGGVATGATAPAQLRFGTGTGCGTGTTIVYYCHHPANGQCNTAKVTPIRTNTAVDLCVLDAATGTKTVSVSGWIAP